MKDQPTPSIGGTRDTDRVLDAGALRALAHPLRVRIFNILSQYGPQTASSLAERLAESSGSTSYHLRALAKQDLVVDAEELGSGRERWWKLPVGGITIASPAAMATPAGRAAGQIVMSEILRERHAQLVEFSERGLVEEPQEWRDASRIATANTHLTVDQMRDLAEAIQTLVDDTVDRYRDQRGDGVRAVTVRTDIFPLPDEGARR